MTTIIHTRDVGETGTGNMGWPQTAFVSVGQMARDTAVKRNGTGSTKFTLTANPDGNNPNAGNAGYARGFLDGGSYPDLGGYDALLGLANEWGTGCQKAVGGWFYLYPGFYANSQSRQFQPFRVANTSQGDGVVGSPNYRPGNQLGLIVERPAVTSARTWKMAVNIYPLSSGSEVQEILFPFSQNFSAHGPTGGPGKLAEGRWYHIEMGFLFHHTNGQARSVCWVDGVQQGRSSSRNMGYSNTIFTRIRYGIVDGASSGSGEPMPMSIGIDGPITVSDTPLGMVPLTATAPTTPAVPPFIFSGAQLGQGWEDVDIVKFWIDPPAYQWNEPFPEFSMTGLNRPNHWPPYSACVYGGQKYVADDGVSLVGINQPIALTAGTHTALAQGWTEVNEGGVSLTRFMGQDTITFTVP